MAGRSWKTEAVVLRSIRYGEADRILHLFTLERGRVGAIAKGARKTNSRFGARLEPFSHVELVLHEGRGELHTVTAAHLVRSHDASRVDGYRMAAGSIGLEAVSRLFLEGDESPQAFHALARFLDLLDDVEAELPAKPALDPLVLSFQLKLLWLSGLPAAPRGLRRLRGGGAARRVLPARPAAASARRARQARSRSRRRDSRRSAASWSVRSPRRPAPGSPSAAAATRRASSRARTSTTADSA